MYDLSQNKYKLKGDSHIGEEIAEQLKDTPPDYVIVPSNNGTLLSGVWLGLNGKIRPRLIAAIAPNSELMASISGYHRFDGEELDKAISESNGLVIDIDDKEASKATVELACAHIFCEPASSASLAALSKSGLNGKGVVLVITGHAFKFMKSYKKALD